MEGRVGQAPVAYRTTFLRQHVPVILRSTRDVLAVEALVQHQSLGHDVSDGDRDRLLQQFFDRDWPGLRVWLPLRLTRRFKRLSLYSAKQQEIVNKALAFRGGNRIIMNWRETRQTKRTATAVRRGLAEE